MISPRACQRTIQAMLREIDTCDAYRGQGTRRSFAADTLRRDGCEICLERLVALAEQLRAAAPRLHGRLEPVLLPLSGLAGRSLNRMDSDVLWSLADYCREELRPALRLVAALLPRSIKSGGQPG
ncbi:hypothetical protein SAMN02745194_03821 [Roseomonas rosea]|uniref:Uncharacterized protein n=1 Tax=Muricoccus roseus TaxID=198092 RepID=A0A1M6NJU4_9PROT|nr:hypothetical protein [Roseomonas rosea]SHJ95822.1 hypothetical protein SAMN02745194_03821 [Roseomonas rosea]